MFRQLNKFCWPYKKLFGWSLIVLGVILLLTFVPLYIWLAVMGILFVIVGIILTRC